MKLINKISLKLIYLLSVFVISYFVATRDLSIGSDAYVYKYAFDAFIDGYNDFDFDFLFSALIVYSSYINSSYELFLFISSVILLVSSCYSLINLAMRDSLKYEKYLFLFVIFTFLLLSPMFFSMQVNVLRQGLASPFIILALVSFCGKKYLRYIFYSIISIGMHWSSSYFLILAPILWMRTRTIIALILALSAIYLSGSSGYFISLISFGFGFETLLYELSDYGSSSDYRSGVRFDFWLLSALIISYAIFLDFKLSLHGIIKKISMILIIPFLMMGFVAYSDRLLVCLWLLIPLLFAVTFINFFEKNNIFIALMVVYLFFSSFAFLIFRLT